MVQIAAMFEVTVADIALLNDENLRSLVGLLCEAEVRKLGLPPSYVTWGGNQDAGDGGLDVRVALPPSVPTFGFVPRPATGFQVKKPKMPRKKILAEMRPKPKRLLRPVIRDLADQVGAYIIVNAESTSDSVLRNRIKAMVDGVGDLANAKDLTLDYYDASRLATWVRQHAGLIVWVRETIGKAYRGWRPYGAWANAAEGTSAEYLLDDAFRVQTRNTKPEGGLLALGGLNHIRDLLSTSGKVGRLAGLSGVGKTRFVQALFDDRYGERALDPSTALYTNMADDPEPQPVGMASRLVAARETAILVIDNCPPDLHSRLSDVCRSPESTVSVITVEYDIREDQPEGTEVFELQPSSDELIEKLVKRRFPEVSIIDARSIAGVSGGNARIAIAIAGTIGKNETIAGLTDEQLFLRLFRQRHEHDESLYVVAQACSLVYSFQGEDVSEGEEAELLLLGVLVGKNSLQMYRGVAELRGRELVQQRGVWRAVLPHALANRLAATALQAIPLAAIETQIVNGPSDRLLKSFSRRLGYLHANEKAREIVEKWLAAGGLLGDVPTFSEVKKAMFTNIAPVLPERTLAALERGFSDQESDEALKSLADYIDLLRSLAYDSALFERCVELMLKFAGTQDDDTKPKAADEVASLFSPYLSGTHATVEQRLRVIEPLLKSDNDKQRSLGLKALGSALEAMHFTSFHNFEFGAHPRDHGYWPRTEAEVQQWYGLTLQFAGTVACSEGPSASSVREVIAEKFRGLWSRMGARDELERVCNAISARQFWAEGWIAVRQTLRFDSEDFTPDVCARLRALEELLRPVGLVQRVRSIVLSHAVYGDFDDFDSDDAGDPASQYDRMEAVANQLGKAVAVDEGSFDELAGELVSQKGRLWSFGHGLGEATENPLAIWSRLTGQLAARVEGEQNDLVFRGFLNALHTKNPEIANKLLDDAVEDQTLAPWYPAFQTAVPVMDQRAIHRLMRSLRVGKAPIGMYQHLAYGRATDPILGGQLKELLLEIAGRPGGGDVAAEVLSARLHSDKSQETGYAPEVIDAGCELMSRFAFTKNRQAEDYRLGVIAEACLVGERGAQIARDLCRRLKQAVSIWETYEFDHDNLLGALLSAQPVATLDGLLTGEARDRMRGVRIINHLRRHSLASVPEGVLLDWCEQEAEVRYPTIACVILISNGTDEAGPRKWTTIALRLLDKAPDRVEVLKQFIGQFHPRGGWSGSLVAILESNAKLLDQLDRYPDPAVIAFVRDEKKRLAKVIENEKQRETAFDRRRDERFE
jgi:hypothetical protein